jgi:hypothetical protein
MTHQETLETLQKKSNPKGAKDNPQSLQSLVKLGNRDRHP